jgi:hypothetical protein
MADGRYLGLLDMLDGGGAGRAGQTFEGGPLSGLMNALGIRPMGYMDRLAQQQPPMRPAGLGVPSPTSPALLPPPNPYAPGAITTTTLPPVGQMSDEALMQLLMQALKQAPSATGYGPR